MKKREIKLCEDNYAWDDLVNKSVQGSPFLFSSFIRDAFPEYKKVGLYENDRLVGGVTLKFNEGGLVSLELPKFVTYQGLILIKENNLQAHQEITRNLDLSNYFLNALHEKYEHFILNNSWRLKDCRAFSWYNYNDQTAEKFSLSLKYTGIIDLLKFSSFEAYMKTIRQLRRREYRKAQSNNLKICKITRVNELLDLLKRTYQRQNVVLSDNDQLLVNRIVNSGLKHGYGNLFGAKTSSGAITNIFYIMHDNESFYYVFGANDPCYRDTGGSTFIMLEIIKLAIEQKVRFFDFCGINSPNRGDYKISFNCDIYPYFTAKI